MTSTETTRFCPMCASPLRPRAAFCHRCGKPFPEEAAVIYKTKESEAKIPTTAEFESQWNTLTNSNGGASVAATENLQPLLPEIEPEENANAEKMPDETAQAEKKQRVRRRVVQTTEYVWEETASDPTWRFVLATFIVLLFTFLVLWFGGFINF